METMPHCDSTVLHAPGKCFLCDQHPELQQERKANHINFTGENFTVDTDLSPMLPDPATAKRSLDAINHWGGNRPYTQQEWDDAWKAWENEVGGILDELNRGS